MQCKINNLIWGVLKNKHVKIKKIFNTKIDFKKKKLYELIYIL